MLALEPLYCAMKSGSYYLKDKLRVEPKQTPPRTVENAPPAITSKPVVDEKEEDKTESPKQTGIMILCICLFIHFLALCALTAFLFDTLS